MSDFLESLNSPKAAEADASWRAEVAKAAEPTPEPAKAEPTPQPAQTEEPAPAPTVPQETATPEPAKTAEEKFVPLKALQEQREEAKELKRKLAELEAYIKSPPPQQEPTAEPDPEQDPIGALKHAKQQLDEFRKQQEWQQYESQVWDRYRTVGQQAIAQKPDFKDAYQYALQSRATELRAFGYTDEQIPQVIKQEEFQIAASALERGQNPADVIYEFAKARGFGLAAPPSAVTPPPPPSQPTPVPQIDPKLEKAKADAATSLTSGGKAPANSLTAEDAMKTLKGAALDAWMDKHWKELESAAGVNSSFFRR